MNRYRLHFKIERGLAEQLGLMAWCDSGTLPGTPWAHLVPVAERLAALGQRRTVSDAEVARRVKAAWFIGVGRRR